MEDIIVLRIGNGISVLTHEDFHNSIIDLFEKMNKSNSAEKSYCEDLIEDLLKKYINYGIFKTGNGISSEDYSQDCSIVLRLEKGMSVLTYANFYKIIYDLYEKMYKNVNKTDMLYYQEFIEDLFKNISLVNYNTEDVKKESRIIEEAKTEEPVKNKKIINITGYKKVYANNKSYASAMN